LIVNGQRVVLPTYEEATSCADQAWCGPYADVATSAVLNAFARDAVAQHATRCSEVGDADDELAVSASSHQVVATEPAGTSGSLITLTQVFVDVHSDVTSGAVARRSSECSSLAFEDDFVPLSSPERDASSERSSLSQGERSASPTSLCTLLTDYADADVPSCSSWGLSRPAEQTSDGDPQGAEPGALSGDPGGASILENKRSSGPAPEGVVGKKT